MSRDWFYLIGAGLVEVGWVSGLKVADSPTGWAVTVSLMLSSLALALKAARHLPATTVYTLFVGLGATGTVLVDAFIFGAPLTAATLGFIILLLAGVVGLKATDAGTTPEESR